MERQNYLGIYLGRDSATVVCLGSQGRSKNVLGCFSVSVQEQEEQTSPAVVQLASLIAEGCAERKLESAEVGVALDCAMFMQHSVHSEFSDARQIARTIRFDTEEALSTDITDVAIAFKIDSSKQNGSELTVFTAQRKILSEVLFALQQNNIDPITIEPDVSCLSRFILQNVSAPEDSNPFFAVLSRRRGYFVSTAKSQETPAVRTFLVDPRRQASELLARQVPVTAALFGTDEPINSVKVFDPAGSTDHQQLSEKLGIETGAVDLTASAAVDPDILTNCADTVDFAIAYGAALAHSEKALSVNFRNDFMPYQGKKRRLERTLKFLSVSVSMLMISVGMYVTSQLLRVNNDRSSLRDKFEADYSAVMSGQKPSGTIKTAVGKLGRIKTGIERKGPETSAKGISAKLVLLFKAFNKCAARTKLDINSISVGDKNIRIRGSTSGRASTKQLRKAVESVGLKISVDSIISEGRRDNITITVVPGT